MDTDASGYTPGITTVPTQKTARNPAKAPVKRSDTGHEKFPFFLRGAPTRPAVLTHGPVRHFHMAAGACSVAKRHMGAG